GRACCTATVAGQAGCCWSGAAPGPRRSARQRPVSSAPPWTCRNRGSTWRSARPARPPGRWPAPPNRRPGRAGPRGATRARTSPASGSASPRSGTPRPAGTAGSRARGPRHRAPGAPRGGRARPSPNPSFRRRARLAAAADAYTPAAGGRCSFGSWTGGGQGVDGFGPAVRPPMRADRAVRKLAELGAYGVNFHDNDVFDFDAGPGERDARIGDFRQALADTGVAVTTATTNLFSHPMFKEGAF